MDLFITSLAGQSEIMTDYKNLTRKRRVNGERSLSFFVMETPGNTHAFPLVAEESIAEYNGDQYRIKNVVERTIGQTPVKDVTATHVFFDTVDVYHYDALAPGTKSINDILSFVFRNTGWTFSVIDAFGTITLEEEETFGGDTALSLFQKALELFEAEYELSGKDVIIRTKIGSALDFQFRYKYNVKTLNRNVNTNDLSTFIKGYGKKKEAPLDTLSGVGKNYESTTGTWVTGGTNHYTTQVGGTFRFNFIGTGFDFRHFADNTGGRWEFLIDAEKKKTVSTWSATAGVKTVNVIRDLKDGPHTVLATFKGDDPKHTPSTGKNTAKGWACYDYTANLYRALVGDELFTAVAEYTSPMADVYGIRHAPPVQSDQITSSTKLLAALKKAIIDKPEVSIDLEFIELQNAGFTVTKPGLGDTVPTIYEPLNVDLDLRIMEIEDYPESYRSPKVTLSNVRRTFADVSFERSKAILDRIWDENSGKIRYNVYTEAVKKATEALNNSLTELEYPEGMGIVARDPNDASRFTILRSAGLGITTNGGETYDNAVTPDGVTTNLLTAGQIKTNNIQIIGNDDLFYWDGNYLIAINATDANKFVRLNSDGLYVKKGAVTIERDDGFAMVLDGKANFDLNIQGGTPQYIDDTTLGDGTYAVTTQGPYTRTASTAYLRFDYFRLRHTSRYAHFAFYARGGGAGAYAYVRIVDGDGNTLATNMTNATGDTNIGITVDMGVPTGAEKIFYAHIRTTATANPCLVRLATKYMTG